MSSQTLDVFEALKFYLQTRGFPVHVKSLSEERDIPSLLIAPLDYVSPFEDSQKNYSVLLSFANDLLPPEQDNDFADSLIFEMRMPFEIDLDYFSELSFFGLQANNILPYGFFYLPRVGYPSLRYQLKIRNRQLDSLVCFEIIHSLKFFFDHMAYHFEAINRGVFNSEKALQNLAEEIDDPARATHDMLNLAQELVAKNFI